MIICPSCKHQEAEGELFCSNCGARLMALNVAHEQPSPTAVFDSKQLRANAGPTGGIGPLSMGTIKPGQVTLSIAGTLQPVVLEGRQEYFMGRESADPQTPVVNLNPYGAREKGVSRLHASLRVEQHQLLLVDLGSTNGTRLNGALLTANKPVKLDNGDEIQLGKLSLKVNFNL